MKKIKQVGTKLLLCSMIAFAGAATARPIVGEEVICNTCVSTIFGWICWNHPC